MTSAWAATLELKGLAQGNQSAPPSLIHDRLHRWGQQPQLLYQTPFEKMPFNASFCGLADRRLVNIMFQFLRQVADIHLIDPNRLRLTDFYTILNTICQFS